MSNPTNEQELRAEVKQILKDGFNYYIGERKDTSSDMKPLDIYCTEHLMQRLTAHTNAEIARTLDRLEGELEDLPYVTDKGGYYIPYEEIEALIQSERAKLKEVK